ncbi:MAG TPA: hypothetical protein VGH83_11990 [Candidatus Acidoferrum sp.]|jgi:hypothetical protein
MDHLNHSGHGVAEAAASTHDKGSSAGRDLFALTDEQILELEPETRAEASDAAATPLAAETGPAQGSAASGTTAATAPNNAATAATAAANGVEPPRWLAEMMTDPRNGAEARDFWQGVAQAKQEAAAYREVFAEPSEARAAAEHARALDEIDRAYFAGDASERSKLAATMMREDPAAFREMVFEGLRALEAAEKNGTASAGAADSRLARVFGGARAAGTAAAEPAATSNAAAQSGETGVAGHHGGAERDARMAAYASFEKAANEELERGVGGAIERALTQALPNSERGSDSGLKARLVGAIRQDVEKALQGDRQLGEQVAQVLSAKQLNNATRAQVVRLIAGRAEQLVPGAAKRILSDWTRTTLAAHRERAGRGAAAASRQEVATVSAGSGDAGNKASRGPAGNGRAVDYRMLSDEQILAM